MEVSLLSLSPAPLPSPGVALSLSPLPPTPLALPPPSPGLALSQSLSPLSPGPPTPPGVAGVRSFFDRERLASNRSRSKKVRHADGDGATAVREWHRRPGGPRLSPTTSGTRD